MPLEVAYAFEEHFFAPVDSLAAETLTLLEERGAQYPYTIDHRRAWSRFVVSLLTRSPEDIITLKRYWRETILSIDPAYEAEYAEAKDAQDPATLSDFLSSLHPGYLDGSMFKTMSEIIDGGAVSEDLATMHWTVLGAPSGATGLLTSDRPLLWSDRFGGAEGHVAMPIGPKRLFVAARDPKFVGQLIGRGTVEELVRHVNTHVVQGARRFVYSQDEVQSRFIRNRFGTKRLPSVIERMISRKSEGAVSRP